MARAVLDLTERTTLATFFATHLAGRPLMAGQSLISARRELTSMARPPKPRDFLETGSARELECFNHQASHCTRGPRGQVWPLRTFPGLHHWYGGISLRKTSLATTGRLLRL